MAKINRKTKKIEDNTENDWEAFGYSCLNNLIMTILYGLIGANFIFYTALTKDKKKGISKKLNEYFKI